MAAAAFGGATDVMRWLHERGCEADARSWLLAARGGCCEAMELLAEWRCPRPRHSGQVRAFGCRGGGRAWHAAGGCCVLESPA